MEFIKFNNTNIVYENVENTPRTAVYLYLSTEKQTKEGVHTMLGNLLLQGTKTKTAEEIATELENHGIEVTVDSRADFLKVSIICLDEDLEFALNSVNDFMQNSTFETLNKEIFKFKNETTASMDTPSAKASDAYYKELFKGHKYGITNTKILETIDDVTINDVKNYQKELLSGRKIISVTTGIKDKEKLFNLLTGSLPFMQKNDVEIKYNPAPKNKGNLVKIEKNDAKQAQIFQGWVVDGINTKDCAKLNVLNSLLGGAGLSSRLFVELRDKKGLAYTVRSSYKTLKDGAHFTLYIGTEPKNIKKSLDGFKTEIQRVINEPPTDIELQGAKESFIGRYKYFYTQTNAQIASVNGWNYIVGLDFSYNEKLLDEVMKVTKEDIIETVKKYLLAEPTTVVLAPKEYLDF